MSTFLFKIPSETNLYNFPSSLLGFCVDSFNSCLSLDADKSCVPVGVTAFSAVLLLLACVRTVCQTRQHPGHAFTTFTYCFLGDVCGAVGALLSKQLEIQIFMGIFSALLSALKVFSGCLQVFLCSKKEKRRKMKRRQKKQYLLGACVFMVVAGGFLTSGFSGQQVQTNKSGRGLLHVELQDNNEILGYVLGLLSFVITATSRFPAIFTAHKGQTVPKSHMLSGALRSLSAALYAAAILLHDSRPGFVLRALPWLLSAVGSATLDLLLVFICWCQKGNQQEPVRLSSEARSLLGERGIASKRTVATEIKMAAIDCLPANAKLADMGGYMDVDNTSALQKEAHHRPLTRTGRGINIDGFCSPNTSWESSGDSSDLEWDFEEINAHWRGAKKGEQDGAVLPIKKWENDLNPSNSCHYEVPLNS